MSKTYMPPPTGKIALYNSVRFLTNADILKHTHKSNPDHAALTKALAGLREVMSHINEDKRKTEGQLQMFDIYNEIDQCPVIYMYLLYILYYPTWTASHR